MLPSAKKFLDITNNTSPDIAVILGSGLTNFFEEKDIQESISYEQLSDFPQPTVKGHAGKLVLGKINTLNVVCMYGRSHIYEGHNPQSLASPIRVLKDIGCKLLVVTNAAGSLDEAMPAGRNKTKLSHQETLENASLAENNVLNLIKQFIQEVQFDDTSRDN